MSTTAVSYGSYSFNQQLSTEVYKQSQELMRWVQFCDTDEKFGQRAGKTYLFDKEFNVDAEGGEFSESGEPPETGAPIRQGSISLVLRGNSIRYTEFLMRAAVIDIPDSLRRRLVNDIAKVHNRAAAAKFRETRIKYIPRGLVGAEEHKWQVTTDGVVTTYLATRPVGIYDVIEITLAMKSGKYYDSDGTLVASAAPIEPYDDDGNYMAMISPGAAAALRKDDDFINGALFADPQRIIAGEISTFHGTRFIEDNHILSQVLGTTSHRGEMVFFGNQTVKRWVSLPPEIREDPPQKLGTLMRQGWVSIEGYETIWKFLATAGDTQELCNTIVHVTST